MRARRGYRGLALLSPLFGLTLAECAPLIGLDEDYYVSPRGGGGGQGGTTPQAGTTAVAGGGSAGLTMTGSAGDSGGVIGIGGVPGEGGLGAAVSTGGEGGLVIPPGKLVFHSYTAYDAGDSEMYIVTFPEATVGENLADAYELCNPINGIFSPDGKTLAVTAEPLAEPCGPTTATQQDVYLLDLENPGSKQKVTGNSLPDEDPQYSLDGTFLLFKHNFKLAKWEIGPDPFTDCANLLPGSACFASTTSEQSKPVMKPGSNDVCYYDLFGADADIFCFDLDAGLVAADINTIRTPIVQHADISDARPNFSTDYLYYVRWNEADTPLDQIMRRPVTNLQSATDDGPKFAVDLASDYSDPFSIDGDLVVFASNITGEGLHDLFIGLWESEEDPRSLNDWIDVNTSKDELGCVFWAAPQP